MLQITPQMKILVAVEPADFRQGNRWTGAAVQRCSSAGSVCRHGVRLSQSSRHSDQSAGVRRPGFLALSQTICLKGRFRWWPTATDSESGKDAGSSSVVGICSPLAIRIERRRLRTGVRLDQAHPLMRRGLARPRDDSETFVCSSRILATDVA
jgi:hypothetical protein